MLYCRQWPQVSDFIARFCTLRESENAQTCENCTRNKSYTSGHCILYGKSFIKICKSIIKFNKARWYTDMQLGQN